MVTHTSSLLRSLTLAGALVAPLVTGCTVPTVVGNSADLMSSTTPEAVVIACDNGGCNLGGTPAAGTLEVKIGSGPVGCDSDVQGSGGTCPVDWELTFLLPAALQTPGVYSLSDPTVGSFFMEALGEDGNAGGCMGGGGGLIQGSFEVVSIDASSVEVRVSGTGYPDPGGNLPAVDGDYHAPICSK